MEDIKQNIVDNLILLRKNKKITQQDLAKQINYTDKAISRWEKGESLPDITVLTQICEYYGVDFEWLIHKHTEVPKISKSKNNRIRIAILLILIVSIYMFATVIFVYKMVLRDLNYWRIFVWMLPVVFSVCAICSKMWWSVTLALTSLSLVVWTLTLSIGIQLFYTRGEFIWPLFLLCIPIQAVIILVWYIHRESGK